ncbi:hypothetical protein B0H12DRAFT_1139690 [Mycena haematopus]|nr:hypothetical protein B0H12DRAFT_1139690 [Mycena haematopus]
MLLCPNVVTFRSQCLHLFPVGSRPASGHMSFLINILSAQQNRNQVIPSWVVVMAAATPTPSTFDAAVASAIATSSTSGLLISTTPPPSPTPTSSTTSRPPASPIITETPATSHSFHSSSPGPQSTTSTSSRITSSVDSGSSKSSTIPTNSSMPSPSSVSGASSGELLSSPKNSQPAAPSLIRHASRNILPTAGIVGIIIGVCSVVLLATLLLCLKRRRRRGQVECTYSGGTSTPAPFLDIVSSLPGYVITNESDARNKSTTRRRHLQEELRRAQQRILDIQQSDAGSRASRGVAAGRVPRVFSRRPALTGGAQSPSLDVISELTVRVRYLEAQLQSHWPLPSDEAPPGYLEVESL